MSNETSLVDGAVRSAVNVDIGRAGNFGLRDGYTRVLNASGLHSLYYAPQKGWTLAASPTAVFRVNPDYSLSHVLGLNSPDPVSYTEYNGNVYFTNRTTLGMIPSIGGAPRYVGVPVPDAPTVTAADNAGVMLPGSYAVAFSYYSRYGEEGGLSEVQIVHLPNGGGFRLSKFPPYTTDYVLYMYISAPDGDVMRFATSIPLIYSSYTVSETNAQGSEPGTQFLIPMPPGDFICWHNGRLFTAKDGALRFSEPLSPHLHDPAHNVIPFVGHIAFIESVGTGLYVGDSRGVWFLAGEDPSKFEQRMVSTCRAVRYSSLKVPPEHLPKDAVNSDRPVAVWLSTSGYVVGMPDGNTLELQPDRIKVPPGMSGRSVFLIRDGRRQIITTVDSTTRVTSGLAEDSTILGAPAGTTYMYEAGPDTASVTGDA
jgi:hypothetical protein